MENKQIKINEYIFKYCLYLHKINSTKVVMGSYTGNDGIHLQDYLSGINVDWSTDHMIYSNDDIIKNPIETFNTKTNYHNYFKNREI